MMLILGLIIGVIVGVMGMALMQIQKENEAWKESNHAEKRALAHFRTLTEIKHTIEKADLVNEQHVFTIVKIKKILANSELTNIENNKLSNNN